MLTIAGGIVLAVVFLEIGYTFLLAISVCLQTQCAGGFISAGILAFVLFSLASCAFG